MEVLVKPEKLKEKDRNQKTVRFSDAHWYSPGIEVLIGGVGGIGSHLAYYLGRQECELYIYDMDLISEVNIGGQLYPVNKLLEKKSKCCCFYLRSNFYLMVFNHNCYAYGF